MPKCGGPDVAAQLVQRRLLNSLVEGLRSLSGIPLLLLNVSAHALGMQSMLLGERRGERQARVWAGGRAGRWAPAGQRLLLAGRTAVDCRGVGSAMSAARSGCTHSFAGQGAERCWPPFSNSSQHRSPQPSCLCR